MYPQFAQKGRIIDGFASNAQFPEAIAATVTKANELKTQPTFEKYQDQELPGTRGRRNPLPTAMRDDLRPMQQTT
jgi:hypothetical protein